MGLRERISRLLKRRRQYRQAPLPYPYVGHPVSKSFIAELLSR